MTGLQSQRSVLYYLGGLEKNRGVKAHVVFCDIETTMVWYLSLQSTDVGCRKTNTHTKALHSSPGSVPSLHFTGFPSAVALLDASLSVSKLQTIKLKVGTTSANKPENTSSAMSAYCSDK